MTLNEVGTNRLGHLVAIGVRKMPNAFDDESIIQSKQFQANHAGRRQSGGLALLYS